MPREAEEAQPKEREPGCHAPSTFSYQDPTCMGAPAPCPGHPSRSRGQVSPLHSLNISLFPQMGIGNTCSGLCCQHSSCFPPSPGLLCSGPHHAHNTEADTFLCALCSATWQHVRKKAEGLHLLLPSELVHIVKHGGPAVTVDHIQSRGRF